MLKKTVTYTNFDDKVSTRVLYFNLTRSDLMDNFELVTEFEAIQEMLEGEERELTIPEKAMFRDLIKRVVSISYGVRSDDGEFFDKSSEVWQKFRYSAVYDEFFMGLFTPDPAKAFEFILGVMPKQLREEAEKELAEQGKLPGGKDADVVELPQPARNVFEGSTEPTEPPPGAAGVTPEDEPAKEWTDYSMLELEQMPQEQFDRLYNRILGPKPAILTQIGMRRKQQ